MAAGTFRLVRHIALHCIASNASRLRRRSSALPSAHSCWMQPQSAADATSLKHVRPKHNTATPRVETSHSLSRSERHGGEDASTSSAPHCISSLPVTLPSSLVALQGHDPRVTIGPFVSLSCLEQIVKHPIDDVRDSAVRRSLQGWSATARGTYICSAGTARRCRATLWRHWLAARNVSPSQSHTAAAPPR